MVTLTKYGAKYNRNILFLEGLSTDTKPTGEFDGLSIQNGSEYTEVDTGKKFLFDYDNATWYEVQTGGGGGGGGTSNYNELSNRPQINSTTLTGNKTSSALGLQDELVVGTNLDSTPTSQSDNPVTSGGVYTALGNKVDAVSGKGLSTNDFTDTLKDKLDGIESGAEANVQADWEQTDNTADDYIKGKPTIPTVNDSTITIQKNGITVKSFTTNQASGDTINITVPTTAADVSAIPTSAKGTASGVAELDSNGKVPSSQLPSYVDDVIEGYYYNGKFYEESAHTTEITGETGKIYIDLSGTNKTYRWSGSGYTEISESLALGETSSTAYRGDRGKTAYDHATESRLTTATASGLYKVASTAEGHIASLTSVQKSDITALGIPAQDTTYTFEGTYNASTNKAATMADIKDGKLTGYAQGSGNVAATDKVIEAIGKVEKKADDNKTNILKLTPIVNQNISASTSNTYTMITELTQAVTRRAGESAAINRITAYAQGGSSGIRGVIISKSNDVNNYDNSDNLLAKVEQESGIQGALSTYCIIYNGSNDADIPVYIWIKTAATGTARTYSIKEILRA